MALLNGILGNASEIAPAAAEKELGPILGPGETVELAYKLVRDMIVLTDRRMIFMDKQGITGKKTSYRSVPYKSITNFSVETAGHFDLDSEMEIWVSGLHDPIKKQFSTGVDVFKLQAHLASIIARK